MKLRLIPALTVGALALLALVPLGCRHTESLGDAIDDMPLVARWPLKLEVLPGSTGAPQAVVQVNINGHDADFIVDTGSINNRVASWFIPTSGAKVTPTPGRLDGVVGIAEPIHVLVGKLALKSEQYGVVTMLDPLSTAGVAGIFSPQLLALPAMSVLVNFKQSAMSLMRGPIDPEHDDGPGWSMAPHGMKRCAVTDSGETGNRYLVPVHVGDTDGYFELATGASQSRLFDSSPAALHLPPPEGHVLRDVSMKVGEGKVKLNLLVIPGPTPTQAQQNCGAMGMLGMDVLRSCVLLLDGRNGLARCW